MRASALEIKAAVKRASAWGTAALCGVEDGILALPNSIERSIKGAPEDALGALFQKTRSNGALNCGGVLPAFLRYDSLDILLALAVGGTAGAPVKQGDASAYAQSFIPQEGTDGLFATICLQNAVNIDEVTSAKITGFDIGGVAGAPLRIGFHILADRINTDSAVNTAASFNNVTWFEIANRVLFSQGAFRMNAQDGPALADIDAIFPSGFSFSFMRRMEGVRGVGSASDQIDEPSQTGDPEIKLKLLFPRYSSVEEGYFNDWEQGAAKKLDMTFTGTAIGSPVRRSFKLSFPNLAASDVKTSAREGILQTTVEFDCLAVDTAPPGMNTVKPFQIDVVNRRAANVLG